MTIAAREDRPALGVAMMAFGILMFTFTDTSAKWLALAGVPVLQVVFARYAGAFLFSMAMFLPRMGPAAFRSHRPGIQAVRALALLGSTVFNFFALSYLPFTLVITINFTMPIVTTVLSVPVLGEKVGIRRIAAVIVGFLGVVVAIQPWGAGFHWAIFLSFGTLLCASTYFILTRMLAGTDHNGTSQLWSNGLPTLCLLPVLLYGWEWPESWTGVLLLAAMGLFASVGHTAVTYAHRLADASVLAPVVYVQLIYATILGVLVFGTLPTVWTGIGAAIIIGSGVYIWQRERAGGTPRRSSTLLGLFARGRRRRPKI